MAKIIEYIPFGHDNAITRAELRRISGMKDRDMQQAIENAIVCGDHVLNMQDGKGYFRPILPQEGNLVKSWIKAELNRRSVGIAKMNVAVKTLNEAGVNPNA